jgi:hypothetical protein
MHLPAIWRIIHVRKPQTRLASLRQSQSVPHPCMGISRESRVGLGQRGGRSRLTPQAKLSGNPEVIADQASVGEDERGEDNPDCGHDQPTVAVTLSQGGHGEECFSERPMGKAADLERLVS